MRRTMQTRESSGTKGDIILRLCTLSAGVTTKTLLVLPKYCTISKSKTFKSVFITPCISL